jgi:hypothetical protein
LIRDFAELCKIGRDAAFTMSDRYELANDIDASASRNMNGGNGFYGIYNSSSNSFTGTFNGKGYKISNLYGFTPQYSIGLFINNSGNISGVHIVNPEMVGNEYVGALVAYNTGNITECSSTGGTLTGTSNIGGLVGRHSSGQITKCNSSTNVSGTSRIGGLIGSDYSSVAQSYATGRVKGTHEVGGFIGYINSYNSPSVMLCYSSGTVDGTGGTYIGGFVGNSERGLTRCYSVGNVSGDNYVGGFVGYSGGSTMLQCYSAGSLSWVFNNYDALSCYSTHTNCYFDITTLGWSASNSNMARTTAEMMQKSTFAGWDFDAFWQIDEGKSYPYLKVLGPTVYTGADL